MLQGIIEKRKEISICNPIKTHFYNFCLWHKDFLNNCLLRMILSLAGELIPLQQSLGHLECLREAGEMLRKLLV